jgi:hypothetical protein
MTKFQYFIFFLMVFSSNIIRKGINIKFALFTTYNYSIIFSAKMKNKVSKADVEKAKL